MENPHMQEQVLEVLDKLRPFLLRDGGDVELVDIEEGIVKLRLMGACGSAKFYNHTKSWYRARVT